MKRPIKYILVLLVTVTLFAFVGCSSEEGKNQSVKEPTGAATVSVTVEVTPGPKNDVDEKILHNLFEEYFPGESRSRESKEYNDNTVYAIRLEMTEDEWITAKGKMQNKEWTELDRGDRNGCLDTVVAVELFNEAERSTWTEHLFSIHSVEIPGKHVVDEEVWVMRSQENQVLVLYFVSVY